MIRVICNQKDQQPASSAARLMLNPVIYSGRQLVTNIDIIETANINAINAWVALAIVMRVNPACLAEIMFL